MVDDGCLWIGFDDVKYELKLKFFALKVYIFLLNFKTSTTKDCWKLMVFRKKISHILYVQDELIISFR